jgi:hypothetical protein
MLALWACGGSVALGQVVPNPQSPPLLSDIRFDGRGGGGLGPRKLHWDDDTGFGDPSVGSANRRWNLQQMASTGRIPFMGMIRWTSTYHDSRPSGPETSQPSMVAWHGWLTDRKPLWSIKNDGSQFTEGTRERGHVSPAMPLNQADWLGGQPTTYGEWTSARLSQHMVNQGLRGLSVADYYDSIPHGTTSTLDFNLGIIDRFEQLHGVTVPGATSAQRATYIRSAHNKLFAQWNDFWGKEYAQMWGGTLRRVKAATGDPVAFQMQVVHLPGQARDNGVDFRQIHSQMSGVADWTFVSVELQGDHVRNLKRSFETAPRLGMHAAYEPDLKMSMIMSAPSSLTTHNSKDAFWASVDRTSANEGLKLSLDQKVEYGQKYLKEGWLSAGWTHVAGRNGDARRAVQGVQRHYHDNGRVPDAVWNLFQDVRPVKPFGAAVYYSEEVQRSFENDRMNWTLHDQVRVAGKNGFMPGYFVSDAALASLDGDSHPTAWITSGLERMPAAERARLEAIAPIYTPAQWDLVDAPIRFSQGASGFAFIDQEGRLVVLANRTDVNNQATGMDSRTVTVTLSVDPAFTGEGSVATDLLGFDATYNPYDQLSFEFLLRDGRGSFEFELDRWDTRVFAVSLVPEPSLVLLPVLCGAAMLCRHRRRAL